MARRAGPVPPTTPSETDVRRLYVSQDFLLVGHLRAVLEANHVPCLVRNEFLIGGAGELPPTECWPEIWVTEDAHFDRARALLAAYLGQGDGAGPAWRCPRCAEALEGQFTACWQCGAERPPEDG